MCILLHVDSYEVLETVHEKIDNGGWTIFRHADVWMEPIGLGEKICIHFGKYHQNNVCKYENYLCYVMEKWQVNEQPQAWSSNGKNLFLMYWPSAGKNYLKIN